MANIFAKKKSLNFTDFLATPAGEYLNKEERRLFSLLSSEIYGYHALQIAFPLCNFLTDSRIPLKCLVISENTQQSLPSIEQNQQNIQVLLADINHLPIVSNSIDLIILPHQLEFSSDAHQLLREIERVLIPEGCLLISGFNPWSCWGIFWWWKNRNQSNLISISRLKDWLKLLNFSVDRGYFFAYQPPFRQSKSFEKFASLEKIGDRWFSYFAGAYMLRAVKRKKGMHLIGKQQKLKLLPPMLNPAVAQVERQDE